MVIAFLIFSAAAVGFLVATVSLGRDLLRKKRARPRLIVSPGIVREMRTTWSQTKTGGLRGLTAVTIDFVVNGKPYVCHTLRLFTGNFHYTDVGKLYDFPRGKEVGLYYDPADPRISALIVDRPRYYPLVIFGLMGIGFLIAAGSVRQRG